METGRAGEPGEPEKPKSPATAATGTNRLDRVLVDSDGARSRAVARELIQQGRVRVDGVVVTKPASVVACTARVDVVDTATDAGVRWVGRGAGKLNAALDHWPALRAQVEGALCVDVGASTGGFTQALLHAGARHVTAIDVGTAQLAEPVAADARVKDRSNTHILTVDAADFDEPIDIVVVDLSFISLTPVVAHLESWCLEETSIVLLVKPQFEVGRARLGKNGIVRTPGLRTLALAGVLDTAYDCGLGIVDAMNSPMTGTHGNAEYLLWVRRQREGMMDRAYAHHLVAALAQNDEPQA